MNKHTVCFGTRDNKYGSFNNYRGDGLVAAIKLVYVNGYVRCANAAKHNSRWGCANADVKHPFNVVGTDQNNEILFPPKDSFR